MAATIKPILDAVALALATNTAIADYITATWPGETLKVFKHARWGRVAESDCPAVQITTGGRGRDTDKSVHSVIYALHIGIYTTDREQPEQAGGIVSDPGAENMEGLASLVERCITDAIPAVDGYSFTSEPWQPDDMEWEHYAAFLLYLVSAKDNIS